MSGLLLWSVVSVTAALVLYTIGVWSCRIAGRLKWRHIAFFWAGLAADILGTVLMFMLADGIKFSVHTATGIIAILLMAMQAVWGTNILRRGDEEAKVVFPRRAVPIWVIWMIAWVTGAIVGMNVER
jgi:uncharacterized repeat protein (TIGR03987 family)